MSARIRIGDETFVPVRTLRVDEADLLRRAGATVLLSEDGATVTLKTPGGERAFEVDPASWEETERMDIRSRGDRIGAAIFRVIGVALVVALVIAMIVFGLYREWRIWR